MNSAIVQASQTQHANSFYTSPLMVLFQSQTAAWLSVEDTYPYIKKVPFFLSGIILSERGLLSLNGSKQHISINR
jgi:hypothetical protein